MSGEALLATPARPYYEPSHRPSKKKERPKSLSFFNTVTDDHTGGFGSFKTYCRCDRLPHAVSHKVRRIAADIRIGSN
jgi:hypothetical protein